MADSNKMAYYPVSDLFIFPVYDRESFRKAFGRQADPYRPDRRIKRWFDPDAGNGPYTYTYFDFEKRRFEKTTILGDEARTLNLPGKFEYEKYIITPTKAVVVGPAPLDPQPVRADFLSTREEAEALARELGGKVVEYNLNEGPFWIDWRDETRRYYQIEIGNNLYNVGLLLKARHADGLNHPGSWHQTPFGIVWVSDQDFDGSTDTRPEVPVPCRELAENEALHITPFGATVYRTDMDSPFNPSSFESRVEAALRRIEAALAKLTK
jgi:hypothetical protein